MNLMNDESKLNCVPPFYSFKVSIMTKLPFIKLKNCNVLHLPKMDLSNQSYCS